MAAAGRGAGWRADLRPERDVEFAIKDDEPFITPIVNVQRACG